MPETPATSELRESLRGPVLEPTDEEYEEARALYNGMIDKRPRWIARCVDAADVKQGVRFARENDV
ncbi:MAG: oxidoreductase, partial [Gemmatimonadota bacterium]|nr:oxidoreductase [Gemmatimonadota bacterium]